MPHIIAICQRKGGCGKSTSCLNLAHVIADRENNVLIIDKDDQQNTSTSISFHYDNTVYIDDVLLNDDIDINEAVIKTKWKNVSIIPASPSLSGVSKIIGNEPGGHLILKEKLEALEGFDYVLIDNSPSLDILVMNALTAANYLFIPLISKFYALQGLKQTLDAYTKVVKRINNNLKLLGTAFVIHDGRSGLANETVDKVKATYPGMLLQNMVSINIKIEEAQVKRQSILSYAPGDKGAKQYIALGEELLARIHRPEA